MTSMVTHSPHCSNGSGDRLASQEDKSRVNLVKAGEEKGAGVLGDRLAKQQSGGFAVVASDDQAISDIRSVDGYAHFPKGFRVDP